MIRIRRTAAGALLLAAALGAQPRPIKPGWNLFSPEQDVQLGRETAAQIEKKVAVVDNRDLTEYVNRIGRKLAVQPEAGKFPYTFKVVYDKSINAFALPGGPTFVHTGLILSADNEAQMAGVLAHEIAHVSLRHGTSQVTKAKTLQVLAGLGSMLVGDGIMGQLTQIGVGLGANSMLLKFSRTAETEADLLGTRMMANAGYNPVEMAHFFEKLEVQEKRSGRTAIQFLSDHPSPGNRVRAVSAEARLLPARGYSLGDASELKRIQGVIQGMPAPRKANTDFRNSSDTGAGRPNGQWKQHQGRGLSFHYPANWEVFEQRAATEITVASREGIAESNGNAEIAFGAILGVSPTRDKVDLDRDTQLYLDTMSKTNRSLQRGREQTKRFQISGAPALLTIFYSASPYQGQKEVDAVITAEHPGGLFHMVLVAPESEYTKAQPLFEKMIQSVQFIR
ncbi:MAG TPA: M48 family metallopeptidase [Bryobacteraceae bacterium]|nr:M48 family metallopeptidase [Bryobacteraceae bacterium]